MIYFHPQRGAIETDERFNPGCRRYRGGRDSDWRMISEPLPKGFLRGDPEKQFFGLGGAETVFGPLEKVCHECRATFVFTAAEQKRWYETLGFFVDATAVRCGPCRRARQGLERARKRYAVALHAAAESPSKKTHLEAARAALQVIHAGGHAPVDKAVAHARRALMLGADAAGIIRQLKKLSPH